MKLLQRDRRRSRVRTSGMELAGALSIASQMALLYPPEFDRWAYRELRGEPPRADRRLRSR